MYKRYRTLKVPSRRWEITANNLSLIEQKLMINKANETLTKRKPIILGRKIKNIMEDFVINKSYSLDDFKGCITTDEHILHNDNKIPIVALWDTGSSYSCISTKLATELKLQPIKKIPLYTSGGYIESDVFNVDLLLGNDIIISVDVSSVDCAEDECINFLIGMDVITFGDFIISTVDGNVDFSFTIKSK